MVPDFILSLNWGVRAEEAVNRLLQGYWRRVRNRGKFTNFMFLLYSVTAEKDYLISHSPIANDKRFFERIFDGYPRLSLDFAI